MESTLSWKGTRYDLGKVNRMRDEMFETVFGDYLGARPEGEDFTDLVHALAKYLNISTTVAFESVRTLAGRQIDKRVAGETAWRLAGNLQRLRAGIAVPPWVYQCEREVVPVQAMSCEFQQTKRGRIMGAFRLRVMAGTPAPMVLASWWSRSFCHMLARRLGYTSYRGQFPFSHSTEIVNMRMLLLLDPQETYDGKPGFKDVRCSPSLKRWNRVIIEKRFRRQGKQQWECPYRFDHHCFECRIGYTDCPAATHRITKTDEQVKKEIVEQAKVLTKEQA